jgi:hypothetical protein
LLPVTRVVEGNEPPMFSQQFDVWPVAAMNAGYLMKRGSSSTFVNDAKTSDKEAALHKRALLRVFEDRAGKRLVWRVDGGKKVPVPEKLYGQFYAGDVYLVQYTYKDNSGKENYVVYQWTGRDASEAAQTAAAGLATEMDAALGGKGVLSRLTQGREPDHFLAIFNGRLLVHLGSMATPVDGKSTRLYHVFGTSALNTRANQVPATVSSINSFDTFVLVAPQASWVWLGRNALGDERTAATAAAETLSGPARFETLLEGKETAAFWDALGGKGEYSSTPPDTRPDPEVRMYEFKHTATASPPVRKHRALRPSFRSGGDRGLTSRSGVPCSGRLRRCTGSTRKTCCRTACM